MPSQGAVIRYNSDYTSTKSAVDAALTKTGASFSWSNTVTAAGQLITAAQVTALKNAVDAAWARFCSHAPTCTNCANCGSHRSHNTCTSHCSGHRSHNSCTAHRAGYNSHNSCSSHRASYNSHNSCSSHRASYRSANHGSNSGCGSYNSGAKSHYGSYCTRVNSRKG